MGLILGADPGLAKFGVAIVAGDLSLVHEATVYLSKPSKLKIPKYVDNIDRARGLDRMLRQFINKWEPDVVCAEAMSFGMKGTVASRQVGLGWGILISVCESYKLPLEVAAPVKLKLALTGNRKASKEQMVAAAKHRYPTASFPTQKGRVDHAVDAVAAVIALHDSDVVRAVRRGWNDDE